MDVSELLRDLYGRVRPLAAGAVDGLDVDQLTGRPTPEANTIAWLIWHLARVQDHHVSELLEVEQVWVADDWGPRFGLASAPHETGYGHTTAQVAGVRPEQPDVLLGYLDAVEARTRGMLEALTPTDLDRVVDRRWDPPVTLGVRLVSIADDSLQHVGQAGFVRGQLGL